MISVIPISAAVPAVASGRPSPVSTGTSEGAIVEAPSTEEQNPATVTQRAAPVAAGSSLAARTGGRRRTVHSSGSSSSHTARRISAPARPSR